MKYDVETSTLSTTIKSETSFYFKKSNYDAIYIVQPNESLFLRLTSNDYDQADRFIIKPNDANITKDSCSVSHKDKLYFYGGSSHQNKVFNFDCDESEIQSRINFNFVGGTCASNNNYILLCFPKENNRLCYKSTSPLPKQWWQWFTYLKLSYTSHDSIALSSGKMRFPSQKLNTVKTPIKRSFFFHFLDEMSLNCEMSLN